MTKKLDTKAIVNDLEGSAFFPSKKSSPTSSPDLKEEKAVPDSHPVPPVRDVRPVPPEPPVPPKRVMKQRWPVDIYQDQYESLKQLASEERMQGGIGSMSAMVREALDKLIAERRQK
jgi:hypothetical protein